MDKKTTTLTQARMLAVRSQKLTAEVAEAAANAVSELDAGKQNKLTGTPGQLAGFDEAGNLTARSTAALLGCMFSISEEGHLLLHYAGETAPDLEVDPSDGHLYLNLD